jgi:hypothetical protein
MLRGAADGRIDKPFFPEAAHAFRFAHGVHERILCVLLT